MTNNIDPESEHSFLENSMMLVLHQENVAGVGEEWELHYNSLIELIACALHLASPAASVHDTSQALLPTVV